MSAEEGESGGGAVERLERVVDLIDIAGRLAASTVIVPGCHRAPQQGDPPGGASL